MVWCVGVTTLNVWIIMYHGCYVNFSNDKEMK